MTKYDKMCRSESEEVLHVRCIHALYSFKCTVGSEIPLRGAVERGSIQQSLFVKSKQ